MHPTVNPRNPRLEMMDQSKFRAFTLVEIMMVVVVIGFLAALAMAAFSRARNAVREKAMINDARIIASIAQHYMAENAISYATVGQIGSFLSGKKISSGVICSVCQNSPAPGTWAGTAVDANQTWEAANQAIVVQEDAYFQLRHSGYDSALSFNSAVSRQTPVSANCLTFTASGQLK